MSKILRDGDTHKLTVWNGQQSGDYTVTLLTLWNGLYHVVLKESVEPVNTPERNR